MATFKKDGNGDVRMTAAPSGRGVPQSRGYILEAYEASDSVN